MASRVVTTVLVIAAILLLRPALSSLQRPYTRLRHCEERLAFVSGASLDRAGWLYGTPRLHDEGDDAYRKRIASARARTFAV
jgi:hypothetical protein